MNLEDMFSEIAIPIIGCPPGLEGAEIEYQDQNLELLGTVKDGHLIVSTADEIPEGTAIVWGKGRWVISW